MELAGCGLACGLATAGSNGMSFCVFISASTERFVFNSTTTERMSLALALIAYICNSRSYLSRGAAITVLNDPGHACCLSDRLCGLAHAACVLVCFLDLLNLQRVPGKSIPKRTTTNAVCLYLKGLALETLHTHELRHVKSTVFDDGNATSGTGNQKPECSS